MDDNSPLIIELRKWVQGSWRRRQHDEETQRFLRSKGSQVSAEPHYPAAISLHIEAEIGGAMRRFSIRVTDVTESVDAFLQQYPQFKEKE